MERQSRNGIDREVNGHWKNEHMTTLHPTEKPMEKSTTTVIRECIARLLECENITVGEHKNLSTMSPGNENVVDLTFANVDWIRGLAIKHKILGGGG